MSEITAELDILPDDDSFLPRYETVQLLAILSKYQQTKPAMQETVLSKKSENFINNFKKPELFTPLTYSIFWREDIDDALANNKLSLDKTDTYNRAPLTLSIANQDFILTCKLLDLGATLFLEDKLVLEIALSSMIQNDNKIIDKILTLTTDDNTSWVKDYLEYLQSYMSGTPNFKKIKYHEILNPPFRHFAQLLDTLSYFNGLPSHYGFLSPSITNLTIHLKQYCKDINDSKNLSLFSNIATAYTFSYDNCKYHGNLPTIKEAAQTITSQINYNFKSKNNNTIVVFGGWAGNSVTIAFINNTLIFSNLGVGGDPEAGTKIFEITNPENISKEFINDFMYGLGNATSPKYILSQLAEIVSEKPLYVIPQSLNPIDNCIYVNPRAIIQGLLLVLTAYSKNTTLNVANLTELSSHVSDIYKDYVDSLYKYSAASLSKFMCNHQLIKTKRIECCSLAIDYINQHYKDKNSLTRCMTLKNSLEFVGLKKYYINNVVPEAQQAIRDLIIHEQEAAALEVIEQEGSILLNSKNKE